MARKNVPSKVYAYKIDIEGSFDKRGYVRIEEGTDLVCALHAICANQFIAGNMKRRIVEWNVFARPTETGAKARVDHSRQVTLIASIEEYTDLVGEVMDLRAMLDRSAMKLFKTLVQERGYRLSVDSSLVSAAMFNHPIHRTHGDGGLSKTRTV